MAEIIDTRSIFCLDNQYFIKSQNISRFTGYNFRILLFCILWDRSWASGYDTHKRYPTGHLPLCSKHYISIYVEVDNANRFGFLWLAVYCRHLNLDPEGMYSLWPYYFSAHMQNSYLQPKVKKIETACLYLLVIRQGCLTALGNTNLDYSLIHDYDRRES